MSEKTLFVSTFNFRPRVDGKVVPITAGTPFEKESIDPDTFEQFLKAGHIAQYTEVEDAVIVDEKPAVDVIEGPSEEDQMEALKMQALGKYGVELKQRKLSTLKEAFEKLEKKEASKPTGIFNFQIEDLIEKELDELDALHAEICADNSLSAPEPFQSIEEGIEKLTSEG